MLTIDGKRPIVFCDFDGTITNNDVIQMVMAEFAPPQWKDIVEQILTARTLSIRDGITQLFSLIPGHQKSAIQAFVLQHVTLRAGFEDFLNFCQAEAIPFNVVSGGIDFCIAPVLAPYAHRLKLYCNEATFTEDHIHLSFPYLPQSCDTCNQCACCKIEVLERCATADHFTISIGDSLTDLALAKRADWVFAHDRLNEYAREENIPVTPFDTFEEIQAHILSRAKEVSYA